MKITKIETGAEIADLHDVYDGGNLLFEKNKIRFMIEPHVYELDIEPQDILKLMTGLMGKVKHTLEENVYLKKKLKNLTSDPTSYIQFNSKD